MQLFRESSIPKYKDLFLKVGVARDSGRVEGLRGAGRAGGEFGRSHSHAHTLTPAQTCSQTHF